MKTLEGMYEKLLQWAKFKPRPPEDPNLPRYGDLNDRVIAAAIDIFLLYILLYPLFHHIELQLYTHIDREVLGTLASYDNPSLGEIANVLWRAHYLPLWLLNTSIQLFLLCAMIVCAHTLWGATPGKRLMGLRVVSARTHQPIGAARCAWRCLMYVPSTLVLMIGIFWISFQKERRGWHDYLAGTVVLQTRPRGWLWQHIKTGFYWVRQRLAQ